jgi:hypothetical protein
MLAGGLAGLAALRPRAVPLMPAVARVGLVQLSAVTALALPRACHDALTSKRKCRGGKRPAGEEDPAKKTQREEDPQSKKTSELKGGKKTQTKKNPHLQID